MLSKNFAVRERFDFLFKIAKHGRSFVCLTLLISIFGANTAQAGLLVTTNGISLTGADGISLTGADGISLTGADGILTFQTNGISLTGADGISLTGADNAISLTGADGATYTGANGISLTGADGISLTGADGISLTGADGTISLTGADGTTYQADAFRIISPTGISLTGADGISLTGADGLTINGTNISLTGADGISLTGADGISLTGADGIVGFRNNGTPFTVTFPNGAISLTGADGISLTGADGISLTGADGISLTGADGSGQTATVQTTGLQSVDPSLAMKLNEMSDDSNVNASIVFHSYPSEADLNDLRQAGVLGGTKFRKLPVVIVTAKRNQLFAVSRLANVRAIYGVRTLEFNADPFFGVTGITRVSTDRDLQNHNQGLPVSGRNVTVAVLDTGVNAQHSDLAGRVIQNVRLADVQSVSAGFNFPIPTENLANSDLAGGHGTFVAGVIAASGQQSNGKYNGVALGAKILGLSAGDANLTHVLAGFDYLLDKGANYNVRVVNCSFSANTIFDRNDPVNVATKMLTDSGVSVVFSAGNSGAGNSTLNPYAAAPWVVSVGATDERGKIAPFSSRGTFGRQNSAPSLVAPGVSVVSLRNLPTQTGVLGVAGADAARLTAGEMPYYTTASGTSFSAPQVAGAIALMLEANPNLQPAEIKDILQRTATPLPPNFRHEVGAGMLNAHAAVIESAFANRRLGIWRANLDSGQIRFVTDAARYTRGTAYPGSTISIPVNFPVDAVQSTIHLAWGGLGNINDLALQVRDAGGAVRGSSNDLNAADLTGRREKLTFNTPPAANWRAVVSHTAGIGTAQTFQTAVETTRVEYINLDDIETLAPETQSAVKESLLNFAVLPEGSSFRPDWRVSRVDFAAALIRGGRVPQFMAGAPIFSDVSDDSMRGIVESVQKSPSGALIYDAASGTFRPFDSTTRLAAAVALVKAAGLQSLATQTANSVVPTNDALLIPAPYRGYVTVALQKGLLAKDGANFSPNKFLTRAELAQSIVALNKIFNQ